ncbi:DUF2341 domain-containing protein [Methanosarcina acetivorans]|nr:DUF2341 domain-containing protein [Methanosarcina acetivorans]
MNINSKHSIYILPVLLILLFTGTVSALPTIAHDTVQGEMYVSSTANWDSKYSTNNFDVPNGTVIFARYYAGVWSGTISTTFNGYAPTSTSSYASDMGVTWVSYDVTEYVIPGCENTAIVASSSGDGRQYGSTLVVVLENESKPQIEYWIAEGLDWMHYGDYVGSEVDNSTTYFNGTVDLADVQSASLYSTHLTGYNYEDFNGNSLSDAAESVGGSYFNYIHWDNVKDSLVSENQVVNVGRGDDAYCSVVLHCLSIIYEYEKTDLVPVNLTPNVVVPNTENTLTATIENQGDKNSTAFNTSLLVDGTVVDTQTVTNLASKSSTNVDFHWTPDGTTTNSYTLTVNVDPENVVNEGNESNNTLTMLVGTTTALTPVADFTATPTAGDAPLTVNFTDQSTNSPTSWAWDFNNDEITDSTLQNPIYTYSTSGTYTVKLTVTNAGGSNSSTKADYITVNTPIMPVANFTATPTRGDAPLTVQFTDTSTSTPSSWLWDFGDGTSSTEQNPIHNYTAGRKYTVKLTATNAAGSSIEEKADYITVIATPVADFKATPTTGDAPLTVNFTDLSSNSPDSWLWDFGDGKNSTNQNPSHIYSIPGNYTVKLTVNGLGGSDEEVKTSYIVSVDNIAPSVTASPNGGLYDHELDVTLSVTDNVDTNPVIYYTTDGSTPTTNSTLYTAPIHIDNRTILKFITIDNAGNQAVQTMIYNIDNVPLTSYLFFKEHTISGSVDGPLTDYQIKMNIHRDTGTDNSSDVYLNDYSLNWPNDIRFTDANNSILSYWTEESDDNTSTVWVKVNSIPTSGTTIKLYYGNANSADMNDGTNTFVAFEDFSDDTRRTSVWTENQDQGVSGYTNVHVFENGGYHIRQDSRSDRGAEIVMTNELSVPVWCNVFLEVISESGGRNPPWTFTGIGYAASDWNFGYWGGVLGYDTSPGHTYKITWTNAQNTSNILLYENSELLYSRDRSLSTTNKPDIGVRTASQEMGEWYYRNFYARTYTANEPVQGEWQSETPLQSVIARFSATPLIGIAPLTVQFTDQSVGNITGWAWDFDNDGTTDSTEQSPAYTYTNNGIYTVKLTVTGLEGGNNTKVKTNYITSDNLAPVVTANPFGNVCQVDQSVTLNVSDNIDPLPVIYYTTDGTDPNTTSPAYTGPISITNSTTLKFMAVDAAGNQAPIQTENYTIDKVAPVVTASPEGGLYGHELDVVLSATDEVDTDPTIYYTTDGSVPTTNSTLYTAPVHITDKTLLKSMGVDEAGNQAVQIRVYYVDTLPLTSYLFFKEHTISGSVDGPLTDYQIKMNIHRGIGTDNGSDVYLNDYSLNWPNDIRFTDANNSILSYWIEKSDDNTSVVWVKVNSIPTSGTTIKLYYGNANSTDMSDGTNTFMAFEDFTDDTRRTSVWTENQYDSDSGYTNVHVFENGGYHIKQDSQSDRGAGIVMTEELSVPVWCSVTLEDVSESGGRTPPWILTGVGYATSNWHLGYWGGVQGGYDTSPGHTYRLSWTNGQTTNNKLLYENNMLLFSGNSSFSTTNKPDMGVRTASRETGEWYFRDFYARTYTANEPVQGEWGNDTHNSATPVANFSATPTSGDSPLTVQFTDQSTGSPTSWVWDFGDGANSTEQNPSHTYSAAGNYTVNLTVENAAGTDFELKSDYIEVSEASGSTVTLYFDPESFSVAENESTEINIVASNFPAGLSGYNLTVAIDDPAVAEIVDIEYPSWALITQNSTLPGTSIYMKTVDLEDAVKADAADVVLATLTVSGKEKGSANLSIGVKRLEEDSGDSIEPALLTGTIEVTLLSPLPDQEYTPRDLDGDGLYEDLTGNGEFSFVDIVAYFHNMDWIEENMPVEYFDFNGNGRIDFDDVVDMFGMI